MALREYGNIYACTWQVYLIVYHWVLLHWWHSNLDRSLAVPSPPLPAANRSDEEAGWNSPCILLLLVEMGQRSSCPNLHTDREEGPSKWPSWPEEERGPIHMVPEVLCGFLHMKCFLGFMPILSSHFCLFTFNTTPNRESTHAKSMDIFQYGISFLYLLSLSHQYFPYCCSLNFLFTMVKVGLYFQIS